MGSSPTLGTMSRHKVSDKEFQWTPKLAYAVGLLVTDGNLSGDGRHINMRSSDKELLETFCKCLNLKNRIAQTHNDGWARKPAYRVQFGNVQLYRWLLRVGLFPNKTYTIGILNIPNDYFWDFLRGHLDGDGSITTYSDRWNTFKSPKYVYTRLWLRFISASREHVDWLQSRIFALSGTKGHRAQAKISRPYQRVGLSIL